MTTALLLNKFQRLINKNSEQGKVINEPALVRKPGLITQLFGCRHGNIGRPFTYGETTYRSCLNCGARKPFNPQTFETQGSFYFPPVAKDKQESLSSNRRFRQNS